MGMLDGKTAVITGGTRGLGLGIARAMARAGAAVVVTSRTQKAVDAALELITSEGGKAAGVPADVSSLEQLKALPALALSEFGRLDIWVNNAGIAGPYGPTLDFSPQDFTRVVHTNILGVYNGSHTALGHFLPLHAGKLINILGHGYNGPVPWQNAYGASKAWVRSFTKSLAEETKGQGVDVFAFNPGMVLTDLLTDVEVFAGSEERLKQFPTVVRVLARLPEVPSRKVVWLASSASDGQTGRLVNIFSPVSMLQGAIKEGWRALTKKPVAGPQVKIRVIPPHRD
jgi:glucose 1-dehydrogenase